MKTSQLIWFNGDLTPWADAKVHVMTHALHYGSSVLEGIRCYATPEGPAIFRLDDHAQRSARSFAPPARASSPRSAASRVAAVQINEGDFERY